MTSAGQRVAARHWATAIIAGMASYLDAAALTTVAISLAIWQRHFDLGQWETGLLSFGLSMSFALGSLAGGWLGDRFGRVRMLGIDVAVFVIGCVGLLLAPNGAALVVSAVVVGLAAGADLPASLGAVSDLVPASARGRLIGLTQVLWIAGVLGTFVLGFAVSRFGYPGTLILVSHLIVLGTITWLMRTRLQARVRAEPEASTPLARLDVQMLLTRDQLPTLVALTGFILAWNIASTTMGSFGPYFLVTVTGLSQSEATGMVLLTFPLSLLVAFGFVRLADSPWRDRLFVVGMLCQIAAFAIGALTGGLLVWGMVLLIVLYSLSNTFAGEAAFKVWAQSLYPSDLRSTATGVSIAIARATAATFLLVVPTIIAANPAALLWVQVGCVTASGMIGLYITRMALRPAPGLPGSTLGRPGNPLESR